MNNLFSVLETVFLGCDVGCAGNRQETCGGLKGVKTACAAFCSRGCLLAISLQLRESWDLSERYFLLRKLAWSRCRRRQPML